MNSLRSRLILGSIIVVSIVLATNGVVFYHVLKRHAHSELEASLDAVLDATLPAFERRHRGWFRDGSRFFPEPPFWEGHHVEVLHRGTVIVRSRSLEGEALPAISTEVDAPRYREIRLPDGRPAYALGVKRTLQVPSRRGPPGPPGGGPGGPRRFEREATEEVTVEFVIARDTVELAESLAFLRWVVACSGVSSVLFCAVFLGLWVGRSLRPVAELDEQIRAVDEGNLETRFEIADAPRELEPILDQLNDLTRRIAAAFSREQSFTGYAAHELRTPIAGLRSTIEVALLREREPAEYRETLDQVLDITLGLDRIVESLLLLTRLSGADGVALGEDRVEVASLVDAAWDAAGAQASARKLTLDASIDEGVAVRGSEPLLSRVIANVVDNAVSYAAPESSVELGARSAADGVEIVIRNRASDPPADGVERVFDPFWRGDEARVDAGRHAGLGLTLTQRIVEAFGGSISASLDDGVFTLRIAALPLA